MINTRGVARVFFFHSKSDFSYEHLSRCQHISPPNVCENEKKHPSLLSQSLASKRHRRPAKTNTVQGKEAPASSLRSVGFGSATASINSDAATFSARKFVVIPVFPLPPLAIDVLVSALRFAP